MSDDDCDGYAWSTVAMAGILGAVSLGAFAVCGNHLVKNGFRLRLPFGAFSVRGDDGRDVTTPSSTDDHAPPVFVNFTPPHGGYEIRTVDKSAVEPKAIE